MDKKLFSLYITDQLKQELAEEAKQKGLSLNSYIIMLLLQRSK